MGMAGAGGAGTIIPQKFVASINNQPVCNYNEQMNIGAFFKMDIDFSADTAGIFDRTLGIAAAILLASKHMQTN
jgi:TRAP-type mannitol/chloroaromatic compound transport system substrate-binding protein